MAASDIETSFNILGFAIHIAYLYDSHLPRPTKLLSELHRTGCYCLFYSLWVTSLLAWSRDGIEQASLVSVLVYNIEDLLFSLQATICDLQLGLVEGFGLVEAIAVRSPEHVRVLILLRLPRGSIPQLAIAFIAAVHSVGAPVRLELLRVTEVSRVVTRAPVGLVVDLRVVEAVTRRCHPVVLRLVVLCRVKHGAGAVPTATDLH